MESPKVYYGYDEKGQNVSYAKAVDATELINPADVQTAIDNVKTTFDEQFKSIADALMTMVKPDIEEAVIVQGCNMGGTIEDTATLLTQVSGEVTAGIEGLYDLAVQAHDNLQIEANKAAYNACWTNGAVTVR